MAKIFIIHGAFGNPDENWFPWLKQKLKSLNHQVIVPSFPTPENQSLNVWLNMFLKYKDQFDSETIFIGHSLAPAFLLSVLEIISSPIKASFFVSGFIDILGNETFDSINKTFVEKRFDWMKIKINCSSFFIYHSDNDPYVPLVQGKLLADKLSAELNVISGAGHFNSDSGFVKFDKLLTDIKSIL